MFLIYQPKDPRLATNRKAKLILVFDEILPVFEDKKHISDDVTVYISSFITSSFPWTNVNLSFI